MTEPVRIGLVGCGRLAVAGYAPAIAAAPGVELTAVADPVAERRAAIADAFGGRPRGHTRAEEMIAAGGIDAVVVASPAGVHLGAAVAASAASLPCLVEKPPAPDLAGARALAELDPAPWIGFNRRFWHGDRLRERISTQGGLELDLELRYRRASWGAYEVRDDVLIDLAPHLVDLVAHLGGGPARLRSARARRERCELELDTPRGPARIRCATDRMHLERVQVRGRGWQARSTAGGLAEGMLGRLRGGPHPLVTSLTRQLRAFCAATRGEDPGALATAEDGVAAMSVIEQAA